MTRFERLAELTFRWEGGYVNHKNDRGGETNMGVTQATLNRSHRSIQGLPNSVRDLTKSQALSIFKRLYWDAVHCDDIENDGLAMFAFDCAVLNGVARVGKFLQPSLGVEVDGYIGPVTVEALNLAHAPTVLADAIARREDFFRAIIANNPTQKVFEQGWFNRLNSIHPAAIDKAGTRSSADIVKKPKSRAPLPEVKPLDPIVDGPMSGKRSIWTGLAATAASGFYKVSEFMQAHPWVLNALLGLIVILLCLFFIFLFAKIPRALNRQADALERIANQER